ncbi:MAG: YcdB/YcdC domain-containing protein [Pseudomonadota bacterium]
MSEKPTLNVKSRFKKLVRTAVSIGIAVLTLQIGGAAVALASELNRPSELIEIPDGFQMVSRKSVAIDGTEAALTRYERKDGRNAGLGGEHVSVLRDRSGQLTGFVRMTKDGEAGELPSTAAARDIALTFLKQAAPDLLPSMELHWIAQHDETITVATQGQRRSITISGMKVKMRNTADGRWFWVIVGVNAQPIVFERDIVWITMPGHRQTEKWLHDSWLMERTAQ